MFDSFVVFLGIVVGVRRCTL